MSLSTRHSLPSRKAPGNLSSFTQRKKLALEICNNACACSGVKTLGAFSKVIFEVFFNFGFPFNLNICLNGLPFSFLLYNTHKLSPCQVPWEKNISCRNWTVRVTKKFLEEHSECIKTKNPISDQSTPTCGGSYHHSPEAFQISEFLGDNWNIGKINRSLKRLGLIEEKILKEHPEFVKTKKPIR